jgi:kynureninase
LTNNIDFHQSRSQFAIPKHQNRGGKQTEVHYFCGNSLGLMPWAAQTAVQDCLTQWSTHGVEAHFLGEHAWMNYHRLLTDDLAQLVGAKAIEVVAMNSLSVNLHLLMRSFYQPSKTRFKILIEARAFPSDRHAVESQIKLAGIDPSVALIELQPKPGQDCFEPTDILDAIHAAGDSLALVLWPGVQYATGQAFDLTKIAQAAHAVGANVGFDLAHAVGNLELHLHESNADFAVWCSYKYLNSGPGAVGGAFVHERHAHANLPRMAGWWGHDSSTRFLMGPEFQPTPGADGWQLSNPPILALAPVRASLKMFSAIGMPALRARALELHTRLRAGITELAKHLSPITPIATEKHGCQLSVRVNAGREAGRACFLALQAAGVLGDWREPDVIRLSPVPMYNNEADIDACLHALRTHFGMA